jgi:hypothetical protein
MLWLDSLGEAPDSRLAGTGIISVAVVSPCGLLFLIKTSANCLSVTPKSGLFAATL